MTALQQQLFATEGQGFLDFFDVLRNGGDIGLGVPRHSEEITEFTICDAYVGSVHISVDDPGDMGVVVFFLFTEFIGHPGEFIKGCVTEEENSFFSA